MVVDFGESALLEIPDVSPSVRYHVSFGQKQNRGAVQVDVKSRSSAGVRKTRKTRYRHKDLKFANLPLLRWKFCGGYQRLPHNVGRLLAGGSFEYSYCVKRWTVMRDDLGRIHK